MCISNWDDVRNFTGNGAHFKLQYFEQRSLTYLPDDNIKGFNVVHLRHQRIFVIIYRLVIRNGRDMTRENIAVKKKTFENSNLHHQHECLI